jgi:hypothetical protein
MDEGITAPDLINRAFTLARGSGKAGWWAMTIPVLKNRLLQLTDRTFRESDFGATSFRDFLARNSHIVSIDESSPPGLVILKSASPPDSEKPPSNRWRGERIREDLWRAVLDYSSGHRYIWDGEDRLAKPAAAEESGLSLPTISPAELRLWRKEFVESHNPTDAEAAAIVEQWLANGLPTAGLPASLRPVWNAYLKRRVEHRLQEWFASNSIEAPAIIQKGFERDDPATEMEELREFIIACVNAMSKQELLELRVSPATAMRVRQAQVNDTNER